MMTWIESEAQAKGLAEALLRRGRARPAVVVSAPPRSEPYVDVKELETAVGDDCEIYVLPTGALTFAFAESLPPGREVYGGASRVYGVDNAWVQDQFSSPLRFAFGPDDDRSVLNGLIEDAMTAAHAAGRGPGRGSPRVAQRRRLSGTIQGVVAGRVLVDVDRTFPAVVYPDRLVPGLGGDRLFREGQSISGLLDVESNLLEFDGLRPAREALAETAVGTVLLARVRSVTEARIDLEVHPSVPVRVRRSNEYEDLRTLFTVSEVVPVEVQAASGQMPTEVDVLPGDFGELATLISLTSGGPPWLVPSDIESGLVQVDESTLEVSAVDDAAASVGQMPQHADADAQEVRGLRVELRRLQGHVARLEGELKQARSRTRMAQDRAAKAEKTVRAASDRRAVATPGIFADDGDQFLHEVYVSWAERTTAADKMAYPWRRPYLGADFLRSVEMLQGVDRSKVVEVVADVACGRADAMSSRGVHQLRTGPGGDDPPVTREGGHTCWRVYLQQNTPSARRLHYWRMPDGGVELSSVRVHDDYTP